LRIQGVAVKTATTTPLSIIPALDQIPTVAILLPTVCLDFHFLGWFVKAVASILILRVGAATIFGGIITWSVDEGSRRVGWLLYIDTHGSSLDGSYGSIRCGGMAVLQVDVQ
jgi:hypothetical protein